jgi:hypothetical protein
MKPLTGQFASPYTRSDLVLMRNWSNRATLAKIPVIPGTPAVRMKK